MRVSKSRALALVLVTAAPDELERMISPAFLAAIVAVDRISFRSVSDKSNGVLHILVSGDRENERVGAKPEIQLASIDN